MLNAKLFETVDFNAIKNLMISISANKTFLRKYKYNLSKINSAMKYYSLFLKEHGYFNNNVEIQNNNQVEIRNNDSFEIKDNKQVDIRDNNKVENQDKKQSEIQSNNQIALKNNISENTMSVVDDVKANRKAFITWLNSHNIIGAAVFKYLSAIKECDKFARNLTLIDKDLYLITDSQNLIRVRNILYYNNEFKNLNERQNNLLLTAFDKLTEFRQINVT